MNNKISIEALVALTQSDLDKEAGITSANVPANLREVIVARLEKAEAAKLEAAADSIVALIEAANETKREAVRRIRDYRQSILTAQSLMNDIDVALKIGADTSNYLALAALLNPGCVLGCAGVTDEMIAVRITPAAKKPVRTK